LLGVDPGEKRVGLALSDPRQVVSRPLETVSRRWDSLRARLDAVIVEHGVVGIVVGLPLREDGTRGKQAQRSETLAFLIEKEWPEIPVTLCDERWSSDEADARLAAANQTERAAGRDAAAAAIVLQSHLDSRMPS
jgi:putative Holliday junction resolvase